MVLATQSRANSPGKSQPAGSLIESANTGNGPETERNFVKWYLFVKNVFFHHFSLISMLLNIYVTKCNFLKVLNIS